jgi:hypothetical protein
MAGNERTARREWTIRTPSEGASGTTATAWTALKAGGGSTRIDAYARDGGSIQVKNSGTGWVDAQILGSNDSSFAIYEITGASATLASGSATAWALNPATYAYYQIQGKMAAGSGTTYHVYSFMKG